MCVDSPMTFPSISSFSSSTFVLVAAGIFFLLTFGMYYPSYFTAGDEHNYLTNAALLSKGELVQPTNEYYCALQTKGDGYFSFYPLGKSLSLVPFLPFQLDGLFWAGALVHILNFILFIFILRALKVNQLFALVYLLFPAFQWSARTLYPELSVLTFFLAAYFMWLHPSSKSAFWAGLLLGIALFMRTDAFLGFIAFFAQAVLKEKNRVKSLVIGFAAPLILFLVVNTTIFGTPLPQAGGASNIFGRTPITELGGEFITFIIFLFVLTPPLSAWAIRHDKKHWILFGTLAIITSIFFVRFYSFWSLGISIPHILTVRLRYFIPAIGLLLIPAVQYYSWLWNHHLKQRILKRAPMVANHTVIQAIFVIGLIGMSGATIFLHQNHQSFLASRSVALDTIHGIVPEGSFVIGSADDCIFFLPEFFGEKKYARVDTLPESFTMTPSTYVLDISYSSQRDTGTSRQEIVDAERQKIKDFITARASELEKVFESKQDTFVTIWRGKSA